MRTLKRMTQKRLILSLLCLFILAAILAACSAAQTSGDPGKAVEAYFAAMVKNDTAGLPKLVCPDYEAQAKTDFDSFGAISAAKLNGVSCAQTSVSGDTAKVTCKGSIDFTYNGENNSQDLSQNAYTAKQVDGEWRMCGYQ